MQNNKLLEFIKKIKTDKQFGSFDEAAIKQGVVLRIFSFLMWDPLDLDEIQPEYDVGVGKVDFAMKYKGSNQVFVVVRKDVKNFKKYQEKLSINAIEGRVKITVLTNGSTWWFSLPLLEGSLEEKIFHTIELQEQKSEDIAEKFYTFLSKKRIVSGEAVQSAENIYYARKRELLMKKKELLIEKHLPKAWEKIMSEPEKWLLDIIAEVTKELCGSKPDQATVEKFLASTMGVEAKRSGISKPKPSTLVQQVKTSVQQVKKAVQSNDYTSKSIVSFTFKGTRYEVKSGKAMLLKICELLHEENKDSFEMVLSLNESNRDYFSENEYEFLNCEKIPNTNIYVNVNLRPMDIVNLSYKIPLLFGYKNSDLSIETK
jgi:predicted type IV restriction endonuclease